MSQDAPALESLDAARVFNLLQQSLDDGKHTRSVLQDILVTLRRSNIVPRDGETRWVRFWHKYQTEADDYDREFLARYKEDMSTTMIFSGLFTAVTATVASMTISNLSQDPNLFTQILLHNIFVSLNHTGEFIQMDMPLLAWNGPSKSVVWSQTFLYASLICSLLAALGAVLATQWLSRYSAVDERGTVEDRGRRRQRKYDGLRTWHFRAFLEALPILLQISLLLFGIALCAYLWDQSRAIALVLIVINTVGGLLWLFTLLASSIYPDSPYDTPLSDFLARFLTANPPKDMEISPTSRPHGVVLRIRGWIATVFTNISTSLPQYMAAARETLDFGLHVFRGSTFGNLPSHVDSQATVRPTSARTIPLVFRTNITEPIGNAATRIGTFVTAHTTRAMRAIASPCYGILRLLGSTVSPIALTVISAHEERVRRSYPSPNGVRIAAFSWLLQTSTDPEVHTNAFLVVPQIVWEDNVFVELFSVQTLDFLLARLATCFLEDGGPRADSVERIVSLCASLLFIYWKLYDLDRNAQTPTRTWSYQTGRPLLELHGVPVVMRSLRDLDLAAHSHSNQDAWIIRYTYYTFRHLEENQERLPLVVVKFPSTTPSESTLSSGSESHFATPLRSHTLLYVSQAVYTIRNSDDCAALLQHIAEYSTSRYATSNTRYICLIATALLLGFGPQEVISFD
ncbi:hypothetical protein BXZ70DRAFT_561577 [Cristinia sonorae]|uniref:DUF6535 domain-containing protein n=1 Tax=Cristinia sonorae TaxID=1940300 RepID=A0A8K0UFN3_9AGAR|nr:hypothetical protein BXZ70DRAFT_561577 [Cristinia sonorae]